MSSDLDHRLARLYATLADEARFTPLPSPEEIRRRSDRQAARRVGLAGTVAAAIAAGAVAVGSLLVGGGVAQVVTTGTTPTGTPTAPPSASSSSSATSSSAASSSPVTSAPGVTPSTAPPTSASAPNPPPDSVPPSVFLTQPELNARTPMAESQESFLPRLCGRGWGDTEPRTLRVLAGGFLRPGAPAGHWPDSYLSEAVVVYGSTSQAQAWLDGLRTAVAECPQAPGPRGGVERNALLTGVPALSGLAGEVVVVRVARPDWEMGTGELTGGSHYVYTVSVRHGDTVTTLHTTGYENGGVSDEALARLYELVKVAAARVAEWRGVVAAD
jgi:hypothetical protein